ncbi:uncharacterized protein [Euwallacea fornicatus]|uniref:uncharacterized protein n=1 Tax=Euwallacea fornicatus TaxID=995702 RepID=UPI00338FD94D
MTTIKAVVSSFLLVTIALAQYQPSSWRPSGPIFRLPQKTFEAPKEGSGAFRPSQPELAYGPPGIPTYLPPRETLAVPPNQPPLSYGPPEEVNSTTTEAAELTTTELPTTTLKYNDTEVEELQTSARLEESDQGFYYIYHPSGLLQKVSYETKDDQLNMAFSAKLKYENVEPIRSPVYTYDPETFVFKRLQ